MCYELSNEEIIEAMMVSAGVEVLPDDIKPVETLGIPLYVVDIGNTTFLCRKLKKGIITVKKVKWW